MELTNEITMIKNLGEKRAKEFVRLNVHNIKDLLLYFPYDYLDKSKISSLTKESVEENINIVAKTIKDPELLNYNGLKIIKVKIQDDIGVAECIFYNQPYLKNTFKKNTSYLFSGKLVDNKGKLELIQPDYELYNPSNEKIIPIYKTPDGVGQKIMRTFIKDVLILANKFTENLPRDLIEEHSLVDINFAIKNIHFPTDSESFFMARKRLVFEELLTLQLALFMIKGSTKKEESNIVVKYTNILPLINNIPFTLTNAQKNCIDEIIMDIKENNIVYRLIQGDVGSGKTIVAIIICYIIIQNNYQAVIMAPTEVLANQHFESFNNLFNKLGISVGRLVGSMNKKEKDKLKEDLESGSLQMLVATHAAIQDDVVFKRLGLAITDEQHRFGVLQRAALKKGQAPHILAMSATPIPRSLALILYGDLDISIINELPPGRQKIKTYAVNSSYRERIYYFIREEIAKGRQAYIVCPAIEENDTLQSVESYVEKIAPYFGKGQIATLHGKMKPKEKDRVIADFKNNQIKIIVSTTVIEVGVNVPNATIMLIEDAKRFGLATLHQLRGRVGRGKHKSHCILIDDSKNATTKARMKAMTEVSDGFKISEIDLTLRGSGDFFGLRQHGAMEFKIANIYDDMDILKKIQPIAQNILQKGLIYKKEYESLKIAVEKYLHLEKETRA